MRRHQPAILRPTTRRALARLDQGRTEAGQKTGYDGRYFSVGFSRTDHARVADAYGLKSWRVTDPRDLKPALAAAIEADGPTLVDIVTQPLQDANAPVSEWVA